MKVKIANIPDELEIPDDIVNKAAELEWYDGGLHLALRFAMKNEWEVAAQLLKAIANTMESNTFEGRCKLREDTIKNTENDLLVKAWEVDEKNRPRSGEKGQ
jgi:hypothetical protein